MDGREWCPSGGGDAKCHRSLRSQDLAVSDGNPIPALHRPNSGSSRPLRLVLFSRHRYEQPYWAVSGLPLEKGTNVSSSCLLPWVGYSTGYWPPTPAQFRTDIGDIQNYMRDE